ncbi:MAG: stage III sporulation protein AG [Clostridia bacterium]|nr:stage III sporulation protein AG [Clostridia bacterium]
MKYLHLPENGPSWKTLLEKLRGSKKRTAAVILCVLALALLAASEFTGSRKAPTESTQTQADAYAKTLETRLAALLSSIDGAGKTQVLVTLRTGAETVWAQNDKMDTQTDESESRVQSEQEYVLVRTGGDESGLPLKTRTPQILGVAVVCEGATDPQVRQRITQTLTAALGIGASHVSVVQMESERK